MANDNPLEKMSPEELMSLWWKEGEHYTAIAAEVRRRLELLAKFEAAIERHGYTIASTISDLDRQ